MTLGFVYHHLHWKCKEEMMFKGHWPVWIGGLGTADGTKLFLFLNVLRRRRDPTLSSPLHVCWGGGLGGGGVRRHSASTKREACGLQSEDKDIRACRASLYPAYIHKGSQWFSKRILHCFAAIFLLCSDVGLNWSQEKLQSIMTYFCPKLLKLVLMYFLRWESAPDRRISWRKYLVKVKPG